MAPKKAAGNKGNAGKKQQLPTVPDSDHIVFGDDKKKKKTKAPVATQDPSSDASKPNARQIVGGASWTGKLPVNLLSEYCQRQKWNKPDYSMRPVPARDGGDRLYRSDVTLSRTDPRTKDTTTLPPIRLPPSDIQLADQPSALEARHFAATYALFRIQSMKNIHMTLPPNYRDLWKGDFTRLKKQDVDDGHGWRYDEDPFAAESKRQEILKSIEKRKEDEKQKSIAATEHEGRGTGSAGLSTKSRGTDCAAWERAPNIVMDRQIRIDVEALIRQQAVWNRSGSTPAKHDRDHILVEITKLGFRRAHIEEALEYCEDQQEVLEWLLVHIPEDDLPRWTFPSNYNAGVSLASGDLEREGKLRRLAAAGYPPDICAQALRRTKGDERLAAFYLQEILVPTADRVIDAGLDSTPAWSEEMDTLEAIFGENISKVGSMECIVSMSTATGQAFTAHFRCPSSGYPGGVIPAISIEIASVPAYVRLSATRKALQYASAELLGEVMVYSICQWLETEIPKTIDSPGRLSDLHIASTRYTVNSREPRNGKGKGTAGISGKRQGGRLQRGDHRSNTDIYETWNSRQGLPEQVKMNEVRHRLPAWAKQEEIIQSIGTQQVTIVSGETGSGKSTQVVQFVLDEAIRKLKGSKTSILCTQPRRVATLSLAERVSSERCSQIGDEVGYTIRGESKVSEKTKITFMTTGVLLRRLQSLPSMKDALVGVTHVFIDEVHERSLDTDFLLALLRECMSERPDLRIVLMSATLDAEIFSSYFGGPEKVALVHIEGRTFPVRDMYLENVVNLTNPDVEVGKAIQGLGFGINYDLIRDLVLYIDKDLGSQPGSILIFLPGTMEIDRCLRAIATNSRFYALPLHASLLSAEQRKVFPPAPSGRRKVVAATNVAETSITIEDIIAVIDTGKVKETNYDVENNIVRLEEVWASLAACKQRRGRAGRVRAGICYKLFTKNTEAKMAARNLPEIQRVPLEQLCLSVKATTQDRDVAEFLARTLTPPDSSAVSNAIHTLHRMNALENNKLTALGTYLAMIPADLRCAKLLVYGTLFDCLEPCLTIASILTVKSPFVSPQASREEAKEARLSFPNSNGDLILDMKAYEEWSSLSQTSRYGEMVQWCSSHFISQQTMRDISSTRRQILDSLKDAGLVPFGYKSTTSTYSMADNAEDMTMLTALIAASLQPQISLIAFPSKKYIASMSGAKELDPEARTIKFFIPDEGSVANSRANTPSITPMNSRPGTPGPSVPSTASAKASVNIKERIPSLSRVFIHPASCLFSAQTFPRHSTHLSYFTKMMTSKPFIRDLTPLNIYSLLFFSGTLELDTLGRGLVVGGVWRVRGWARIGVLVSRLRVLLDEELRKTVESGSVLLGSMIESEVVQIVRRLLVLNGQDK